MSERPDVLKLSARDERIVEALRAGKTLHAYVYQPTDEEGERRKRYFFEPGGGIRARVFRPQAARRQCSEASRRRAIPRLHTVLRAGRMSVRAVKGMAHFAGTGPSGTYCHECKHWNGKRPQWEGQPASMGTCALSKPLTPKGKLVRFKGNELSCNKFEAAQ